MPFLGQKIKKMKEKSIKPTDSEQVTAYIQNLEPNFATTIQALRDIILSTDADIAEEIKWNAPTFFYAGEMLPSPPKEHKKYIIVTNFHKGRILLVFPSGAKINDTSGFLEGDYADGRRLHYFKDLDDVLANKIALQNVVSEWIKLIEKP
jgi:hypothetical protein